MHVCTITPIGAANTQPAGVPLTPAAYLTLRRKAAGFTIESLARALVMVGLHGQDRPTMKELRALQLRTRDQVMLMERAGAVIHNDDTLRLVESVMPFDPAVYRQLADHAADRHPKVCLGCGCSGHDPCHDDSRTCTWVTDDACSHCVERAIDATGVAA